MSFLVTQLTGFGVGSDPFELAFVTNATDATNLTTYTFSTQSFGAPDPRRIVVVGVIGRSGGATTISSVTAGGVTLTEIVTVANSAGGDTTRAAIYAGLVPTGATGDVVVTFSGGQVRCAIGIWRMLKNSMTAFDTGTSVADDPTDTLNIPAGGAAIGIAHDPSGSSSTTSWVGLTESFDTAFDPSTNTVTGATGSFATQQTGLTVTANFSAPAGLSAGAFASWGPD
jgi:hypothetical protein